MLVPRKVKRIAAKLHQARVAAYLIALAEQKKKEEEDRRRKDERQRKRAVLLSQRIQNEANERKGMGVEDKPMHQQTGGGGSGSSSSDPPPRGVKGADKANKPRDAARDVLREAAKEGAAAAVVRKAREGKDVAPAAAKPTAAVVRATERPRERVERPVVKDKDKAEAEGAKEGKGARATAEATDAMVQRLSKVTLSRPYVDPVEPLSWPCRAPV